MMGIERANLRILLETPFVAMPQLLEEERQFDVNRPILVDARPGLRPAFAAVHLGVGR
jgi:hypothetical protein